jgi:octaprenyl-diphosphate synthase
MKTKDPLSFLNPLAERVNQALRSILEADKSFFGDIGLYSFLGGGKRLRPLIFCLSYQALGRELDEETITLSAVFELLHMASLLHDDIVDKADTRRGRPAAHTVFGLTETVLCGDYLLSKAATLAMSPNNFDSLRVLVDVIKDLSLGELEQLKARHQAKLSQEIYYEIILKKTGVLIEAAAKTAAIQAGAGSGRKEALSAYGRKVGLAFQIMDDVLDYQAGPGQLGKPVGLDLDEGRITLPFILARDNLSSPLQERLISLGQLKSRTKDQMDEVRHLVKAGRGIELSTTEARKLSEEAISTLEVLEPSQARRELSDLARFMVHRDY